MKPWVLIGAVVILAAALIPFWLSGPNLTGAIVNTEDIKIPLSEITSQAKWYEYDAEGVKVRFFAVRASDGSVKTGFDACDVCYTSKKGYRQEGGYMVCNNCGNKYPIDGLGVENKKTGGCWPGYLPSIIKENALVINKLNLEEGKKFFV